MRAFIFVTLLSFIGVESAPLPDGPWGVKKWIKINDIEYEVPMHMSPEEFRQSMLSVRSNRFQNVNVQTFQRPTQVASNNQWAFLSGFQPASQPQYNRLHAFPPISSGGSFHVGFVSNPVVNLPQPPITTRLADPRISYPQPPVSGGYSRFHQQNPTGGSRQWVKLAEGHTPIEVPFGRNPQEFLNSLRSSSGFRYLSGKHSPAPIIHSMPPLQPPPAVTKVAYEILPPPTKKAIIVPPPSKKSMAMPMPPSKGTVYMPQFNFFRPTKMAPAVTPVVSPTKVVDPMPRKPVHIMPSKHTNLRPMYVAARPVAGWGGKKW